MAFQAQVQVFGKGQWVKVWYIQVVQLTRTGRSCTTVTLMWMASIHTMAKFIKIHERSLKI